MDLSINIISFNCKAFLRRCLETVRDKLKSENISSEIIIVDNNSLDGTSEMITSNFHYLNPLLIKNPENYGVAKARNQAIKVSKGRYILLLDADTEILSTNFKELIDYMDRNQDIAILGCYMLDSNNEFYPSARTFPSPIAVVTRRLSHYGLFKDSPVLRKHHVHHCNDNEPIEVDFVIGAFQLIRKIAMDKVGLLDENMFYGFEDADYCYRMKKNGLKVVYYPSFSIKHHVQSLSKRNIINKMLYFHINSYIRLLTKYYFSAKKYSK